MPVSFEVEVVEFPATHLIGMKIRTDMKKAQTDCTAIWQTFGPRIAELPPCDSACKDSACKGAFGVSVMINENDFDYWAAVEGAADVSVPNGMETTEIPGGPYVRCRVADFGELGRAYEYVYGQWISGQAEYALNMQAPGFELYPTDWKPEDAFDIYAPLIKKS